MTNDDSPPGGDGHQPARTSGWSSRLGPVMLGLALAGAVAAGFWVLGGGDGPASPTIPAFPTAQVGSGATPVPGTGVFDPQRPEVGEMAPDFGLVDARDPSRIRTLSEFRGKPVVLNWYASWCEPCEKEIPAFLRVEEQTGGAVVFIGVDFLEDASRALILMDRYGATFPALLDSTGAVKEHYRIPYIPGTYFIDAEGIIREAHIGEIHDDQLAEKLATIGVTYRVP